MLCPFAAFATFRFQTWNRQKWIYCASFIHNAPLNVIQPKTAFTVIGKLTHRSIHCTPFDRVRSVSADLHMLIWLLFCAISPMTHDCNHSYVRDRRLLKRMTIEILSCLRRSHDYCAEKLCKCVMYMRSDCLTRCIEFAAIK